jgi:hypothetical protein
VRRVIAGSLLSLGLLCGAVALGAWWVNRTAFDTRHTADIAEAALQNPDLRNDLASAIADHVAPAAGLDHATVQAAADAALVQPDIAVAYADVLRDVHARLVGEASGPVTVPPNLVALAVGTAVPGLPALTQLPPVTVDVPTIDALDTTRRALQRTIPILIAVGAALALLGVAIHPRRAVALRTVGAWLIGASIVELILAYAVPTILLPAVVDSPYADLVAEVDKATIGPLVGVLVMMAGTGLACLVIGSWLDRPPPVQPQPWATSWR